MRHGLVCRSITSVDTSSQVATSRARVDNAKAGILAAEKQYEAARARLAEAKAYNAKYQSDLRRYTPLVSKDIISRQQYDQVLAAAQAAAAGVEAADAAMRASAQQVSQARGQLVQVEAELRSARTALQQVRVARSRFESARTALKRADSVLKQAGLNLQYTKVVAPVDVITGKKSVEVGQNVLPGQVLAYLVPVEDIWVTANFRENQLRKIRPGQRVRLSVDAYGKKYDGYVENLGAALGREEMGNASGIFNLMRNVGGSVGISIVTTLLARKAQLHQNDMAAHLNLGDLRFGVRTQSLQRLFQGYFDPSDAARMAQGRVYGELQRQATLLAYVENFRLLAFACFFCIAGVFFFKRVKAKGPPAGGH